MLNNICEVLDRACRNHRDRSSKITGPSQWITKAHDSKSAERQNASGDESVPDFGDSVTKDEDRDEDDVPSIKRHCTVEPGVFGVDKLRLATHIENSLKQVTPQGVEGTLTAIEDLSKVYGVKIDRDRCRNVLSQSGGTTFIGFICRVFPIASTSLSKQDIDPKLFDRDYGSSAEYVVDVKLPTIKANMTIEQASTFQLQHGTSAGRNSTLLTYTSSSFSSLMANFWQIHSNSYTTTILFQHSWNLWFSLKLRPQ